MPLLDACHAMNRPVFWFCPPVLLRDAAQHSMGKCLKCDADTDSKCEQCGDPVCNDCGTIESITDDERGETYETMYCEDCAG